MEVARLGGSRRLLEDGIFDGIAGVQLAAWDLAGIAPGTTRVLAVVATGDQAGPADVAAHGQVGLVLMSDNPPAIAVEDVVDDLDRVARRVDQVEVHRVVEVVVEGVVVVIGTSLQSSL